MRDQASRACGIGSDLGSDQVLVVGYGLVVERVHAVARRRRARLAVLGLLGWAIVAFTAGLTGIGAPVVHIALGLGLVALALAGIPIIGRTQMLRGRATAIFAAAATTSAIALIGGPQRWSTALHVVFATGLLAALIHLARVAWKTRTFAELQTSART